MDAASNDAPAVEALATLDLPSGDELWDALGLESPRSVTSVKASQAEIRAKRRDSERKSREKRQVKVDKMREQIKGLECAIAVVTESESDATTSDSGSEVVRISSPAMRRYLQRSRGLVREAAQLRAANKELEQMVKVRETAVADLRKLTHGMVVDEWALNSERWFETTMAAFTPWTLEACAEVVRDSLTKIRENSLDDGNFETTGLSILGWRDRRRLDKATGTFYFSFRKRYSGVIDVEAIGQLYWQMISEDNHTGYSLLAPNVKSFDRVIQRVSRDISIIRCVEQYPEMPVKAHMLMMVFRVRTPTSIIVCARSIPSPEVEHATLDDDAYWTSNFYWVKLDVLKRNSDGLAVEMRQSISGTLASENVAYASRWMGELILSLIYIESQALGTSFLGL